MWPCRKTNARPWGRLAAASVLLLTGCSQIPLSPPSVVPPATSRADAVLTPGNRITRELTRLPDPKYRIPVGVYAFRDMSGQFKPQPDSNLSNAVTQGAGALLEIGRASCRERVSSPV